jgi:Cu+-exporting ATPase
MAAHPATVSDDTLCYHCGEPLRSDRIEHDGKLFCCRGCTLVYDVLARNQLYEYYTFEESPGRSPRARREDRYAYLDDPAIAGALLEFTDGSISAVTFTVPGMHCSACVWLLENLQTLDAGIVQSRVEFLKKRLSVRFTSRTSLRGIVELLASLGYEPELTVPRATPETVRDRSLYTRIGVAGFAFGNIMLLSLPAYLSGGDLDPGLLHAFAVLNFVLSLPVVFYAASGYFRSSAAGLSHRVINLDVPIALGILILFGRSLWEVVAQSGQGYFDSLSGLVFFLLLGRLFQSKTYESLNFDRDFRSYFPLAVSVRRQGREFPVPLSEIVAGDRIIVRNGDIIPADSVLLEGEARIDYSFVTGESTPVMRDRSDLLYAGGRQLGVALELEVIKPVSQSYLTQLWNEYRETTPSGAKLTGVANGIAKYFTGVVLALASLAALWWFPRDPATAWAAVTGILIVACPCALALSTPFAFGTTMRILGKHRFYVKAAEIIEALARIDTVVMDKTGTMSEAGSADIRFVGEPLAEQERQAVASLARQSTHPLSRAISGVLGNDALAPVQEFSEIPGEGLRGVVNGCSVNLGSPRAHRTAGGVSEAAGEQEGSVAVSLGGVPRGAFAVASHYREGLGELARALVRRFSLVLLSGDNDRERQLLGAILGEKAEMFFEQSPLQKLSFVRSLRSSGRRVLMLGDGLNDAGALRESSVGISVTDNIATFSPASDAILHGEELRRLDRFLALARDSFHIVLASFGISFLYNVGGLSFAFRGELSPVVAAILMPLSSITVVAFTTMSVRAMARHRGLA